MIILAWTINHVSHQCLSYELPKKCCRPWNHNFFAFTVDQHSFMAGNYLYSIAERKHFLDSGNHLGGGRCNRLGWADQLIGLWLVKTSHITLFSISGLTMGVRTLQTQDTSDLRQFGTISLVPKCLTFLCRYQCRSVSTFYKGAEDSYEGT